MKARAGTAVVVALALLALPCGAQGSPAGAAAAACPELARAQCSTVTVPLDRTGATPGAVDLAAARVPASKGPARGTILFLAGGPGESASPPCPTLRRSSPGSHRAMTCSPSTSAAQGGPAR